MRKKDRFEVNIGEQISRQRKQKGLSQDEFVNVLKGSRPTVSNWEDEKSYPDLEMRSEFRKDDVNFTMSDSKTYQVSEPTINVANAYFTVPKSGQLDLELDAQIDDGELHVLITDSNKQNFTACRRRILRKIKK